jgi:serine/threonine protein kinase
VNYPSEIPLGSYVDKRYQIVKILGQGGFGRTYLVKDKRRFEKYCALKEFVPQSTDPSAIAKSRELFEREAKVLNQLEHQQIPKFYGWFEEDNRLFLVQQFVDGKTYADLFQERQQQGKVFSETEVTQLLKDILPVLKYLHDNHIIHRDISPDNIMLCNQVDKPILIDFGVVNQRTATQVASGAVKAGTTVGKQSFSPTEQIRRGTCFPSSDLYALAVTTMVLLTGKQPSDFYDSNQDQLQWRRYTQVSDQLARMIDKMSAESLRDRYQSALEVLTELGENPKPNPSPFEPGKTYILPQPTLHKKLMILGGTGTVILIASLFFWLTPNIEAACKALNNCSSNLEFKAKYDTILERAEPIITMAADDNNLNNYKWGQLQDLKAQLESVIQDLEIIPSDIAVAEKVIQTLEDTNTQLKRVNQALMVDTKVNPTADMEGGIFDNPSVQK